MTDKEQDKGPLADLYDSIGRALKNTPPIPQNAIERARDAERAKVDATAESLGVTPEDYRKWASGVAMPHVQDAFIRSMK